MRVKGRLDQIRIGLFLIMILICVIYGINKLSLLVKSDASYPEITFEQDILEVSVKATEEELLQGVTAYDKKDGDVTDSLMIESMSTLLDGNQRLVTYIAFDEDNHVGKAEHRIQYTDYTPIRFSMESSLEMVMVTDSWMETVEPLRATDCIDGDLTGNIVMVDHYMIETTDGGTFTIYELQVSNSSGDMATLQLPVPTSMDGIIQQNRNAELELKDYLIYRKVGESVDYKSLISNAMVKGENYSKGLVQVDSNLDILQPGSYTATYTIEEEGARATCYLTIIVEE